MSETAVTPRPVVVSRSAPIRRPLIITALSQRWKNRKHSALPDWLPAVGTPGKALTVLSISGVEHTIPRGADVMYEGGMVEWHCRRGNFGPVHILDERPTD
jgi:hypothetical protein